MNAEINNKTSAGAHWQRWAPLYGIAAGVVVQATLIDVLLKRLQLMQVSEERILASVFLACILVGGVCFAMRVRGVGQSAVRSGFLGFGLFAVLVMGVMAWLRWYGVVIDATRYLMVLGISMSAGVVVNVARISREAHRRDMEMDLLLIAGRRQVTEVPDQDTPRVAVIPGASQMALSASVSLRSPEIVAETLCQGVPCQGCVLFSIPEGSTLSFDRAVYHAFSPAFPRAEVERIAVRFAWETLKQSRPIIHSRRGRNWMFQEMNPIFVNLLGVPVIARGQPLAVAVLFNKRATPASPEREFTDDHLRLVSALRYQAAALLENARRYQLEYAMFDGFARSLAKAVDFRDNYTRGHSERVAELSAGLARELGLSEGEVEIVQRAATLHDLGKIGVNDIILRKPGRLSDNEFSMIRAHAANGFEILKAAPSFEALLPGIRHHHERYDGVGYPDGLAGNAIPLIARIISAADAYDAMTSNRPYRKALAEAKAREELRAGSGTQFDPQVVEALLSYLNKRGMDDSAEVTQTAQVLAMLDPDEGPAPADKQPAIVPPPR